MDRQVYVWNSAEWETMEKGLPRLDEEVAGFEAIAGFSMSEIYCAGWYGEIWRSDGIQWEKLDSPTSAVITNIACGDDGFVYACGRRGLLIRGRNDSWEVIETGAEVEDFWGITWFQGKLYLSSMTGVSYLEDNQLYPVGFGDDTIATFYELAATTDALWSIGAKDLMSFDGETWTRIE
jgi:hypothetical protein